MLFHAVNVPVRSVVRWGSVCIVSIVQQHNGCGCIREDATVHGLSQRQPRQQTANVFNAAEPPVLRTSSLLVAATACRVGAGVVRWAQSSERRGGEGFRTPPSVGRCGGGGGVTAGAVAYHQLAHVNATSSPAKTSRVVVRQNTKVVAFNVGWSTTPERGRNKCGRSGNR